MTGFPSRVKVGGAIYRIERWDRDAAEQTGNWAQTNNTRRLIQINETFTGVQFASSLLHEILHAISFEWSLDLDPKTEEQVVNSLECGLHAVIVDNREVIDWMIAAMRLAVAEASDAGRT